MCEGAGGAYCLKERIPEKGLIFDLAGGAFCWQEKVLGRDLIFDLVYEPV